MDDTVAGNGNGDRIRAAGARHGARRFRGADGMRDILITRRAACGYPPQGAPHLSLKVGAVHVEGKRRTLPGCCDMTHGLSEPRHRRVSGRCRYRTGESAHHVFDELASGVGEREHADSLGARGG